MLKLVLSEEVDVERNFERNHNRVFVGASEDILQNDGDLLSRRRSICVDWIRLSDRVRSRRSAKASRQSQKDRFVKSMTIHT